MPNSSLWRRLGPYRLSGLLFLMGLTFGASFYGIFVWRPVIDSLSCEVVGQVAQPFRFSYLSFIDQEVTIEAELIGTVTHLPLQNYTGVPLYLILSEAQPLGSANLLQVIASDGYSVSLTLSEVLSDSDIILVVDDGLRLIAKNYPGEYWVQKVVSLVIT